MQRLVAVVGLFIIVAYVLAGRSHWFSEEEREARRAAEAPQVLPIELGTAKSIQWKVETPWDYEDHYRLALAVDLPPNNPETPADPSKLKLDVRVTAVGKTEDGRELPRRVEDWYWKGDRPFRSGSRIWVSRGRQSVEYSLALLAKHRFEELTIQVDVLEPDPRLDRGNPRLLLRREASANILHHMFLPRLLRDGGLVICIISATVLAILVWKGGVPRRDT